ncbi:MAG: HD domain-containing protein [Oscillospiraceae bacterium]|nr:HD domain-containing protein [Oscillospiraceae bacterium]
MKKTITILLSLVIMFAASVNAFAEHTMSYVGSIFNDRNGLPTGEANAVVQTPDGYIWIGSYAGLIRYDGTVFRNFSEEGALQTATVRSLFVDSSGRLWVGSNDMGVFCMENDVFVQPEGQPADSFSTIRSFTEGENGDIYVSSSSGLARVSGGVMSIYDAPELFGHTVYSTAVDKFGRVWCSTNSGCCVILPDGTIEGTPDSSLIFRDGENIYSLASGKDGAVWFGSDSNILAMAEFTSKALSPDGLKVTYYSTENVYTHNSIGVLPDGGVTVHGLRGFGILRNGGFLGFGEDEGAASVEGSCVDYEGNIWLASSTNGVVKFTEGCYSTPDSSAGLSGKSLNTIVGQGGYFFMGTDNGLLICTENWKPVSNDLTAGLDGIRVRHIIADSKGYVWIASYSDTPVIRVDPANWETVCYTQADGLADRNARTLLEMSDGSIAVGMQNGLSIITPAGNITGYNDLAYPAILCMTETSTGALLAGSDGGGIYEIDGGNITVHSYSEGLDNGIILRIIEDSKPGCLFVSTSSGMFYYNGTSFRKLSKLNKSPGNIFDMYLVGDSLYLLQNSGILTIPREDVIADNGAPSLSYGFEHGLSGSLYANTWHWLSPDGKLYLATSSGVSIFGFHQPESILPKGVVNSITVDGTVTEHPQSLEIKKGAHRITIDFAALSYTGTTRLAIAYKLDGFDSEETVITGEKKANISYTNLPGGEYTFTMRIFLTDHPEQSETYTVPIKKERAFSEKPAFVALLIFCGIAFAVGITSLILFARIRVMKRRQKMYKEIIDQSLKTFAGTIDAKDKYTNGHSLRVAKYSQELARRMNMSKEEQERIYYIAMLHDIGKIGIPDNILNKPGKLTDEERQIIQKHPAIGADILKNYTAIEGIADGARYHHERIDGKGYCEGLSGDDIPLIARIIGVADTYDAMSSRRCYRDCLSSDVIIEELKRVAGSQLDRDIVPHMLDMIKDGTAPIILPEDKA